METTSLQIELLYLFSKYSSWEMCIYFSFWRLHLCFLGVVELQGLYLPRRRS